MWLDSGYGSDKGLVIPGTPVRYAADFRLSVDGVHIEKVGIHVALPWAETGKLWHLGSYVRRRNSITQNRSVPSTPSGGIINSGLYARGEVCESDDTDLHRSDVRSAPTPFYRSPQGRDRVEQCRSSRTPAGMTP